ncbi:MAG: acetylornithine transaminase [Alphaproteobacteria bacterium 64-11]|nr:aspartate aminotransferase family protein [Alphaproteobacteria bacterium]OJU08637.1 MAG: acetylornithine transaminase [Alphaproteobacteria bacterium 64-11]
MFPPLLPTYNRTDVAFVRGEGSYLFAEDGKRYLDFGAGIAVNAFGIANPRLVKALTDQAGKLWHTSNLYRVPGQESLSKKLVAATFADTVFFVNSGTEAIELAIKMARRHHFVNGQPDRFRIVTFEGAFHGRTYAAINAGGNEKYLEGFGPRMEGFDQVTLTGDVAKDLAAVKALTGPATAAILIEPLQGESGVRVIAPEFLRAVRKLCDQTGTLLVLDEIQTGVGRTGRLFAHEWIGITPDIMTVAKAIGGGFPLGAVLATADAANGMTVGTHGTTYGGNPLAMAVGNEALDMVLEPGFLDHVNRIAGFMAQQLGALVAGHPAIFSGLRGQGLMLGLTMKVPNTDFINAAREAGVIVLPAGDNVVRLLPALTISEDEVREGMAAMDRAAAALESKVASKAAAQ